MRCGREQRVRFTHISDKYLFNDEVWTSNVEAIYLIVSGKRFLKSEIPVDHCYGESVKLMKR